MRLPKEQPPAQDRDRSESDTEARYHYDREGYASTLAYVATYQHALASEYLDRWRIGLEDGQGVREDLRRFEHWRFGAELYPAAHGVLLHAVLLRAFPQDQRFIGSHLAPPKEITTAWTPGEYEAREDS